MNFLRRIWNSITGSGSNEVVAATVKVALQSDPLILLGLIQGASDGEVQMIRQGYNYLIAIVRSDLFAPAVMSSNFTNTNGLTNAQILQLFITTKMVVNVDDFSGNFKQDHIWHTEGYENDPPDGFVHVNRYFIQDALSMGSIMLHELSHEPLGFRHASSTEYTSIPYSMNRIFLECAGKLGIK